MFALVLYENSRKFVFVSQCRNKPLTHKKKEERRIFARKSGCYASTTT